MLYAISDFNHNNDQVEKEIIQLQQFYSDHIFQASNLIPDSLMIIHAQSQNQDEAFERLYCLYVTLFIHIKTCDYTNNDKFSLYEQCNHIMLTYYENMQDNIPCSLDYIKQFNKEISNIIHLQCL